jgi:hypothetical protein
MVFKAICTKNGLSALRPRLCDGFTLVETLMGVGLGGLVIAMFLAFLLYTSRSFSILTNHLELHQANRQALDTMTRDIRQVRRVTRYATNSVTFEDADGMALDYTYDVAAKTLTRVKGASTQVLLTGCDSILFDMLQRNVMEGSYDYYPADDVHTCKVLRIRWKSSRQLLGKKSQVSEDQSTDVVIRKQ